MTTDVGAETKPDFDALQRLNEASFDLTFPSRRALADGDGPKALALLERKHQLVLDAFGPAAPSTGTSLLDLSRAYHMVGRYAEARSAIEQALQIYTQSGRSDARLDELEEQMMETCAMQGHSFEVERIAKSRIARLQQLGVEREYDRAITQDNLARLYINQRRSGEAIPLLDDALRVIVHRNGEFNADMGICLQYLSQAHLSLEQWDDAEHYARRALACARHVHGENSLTAAMSADECSVALGFSARASRSAEKAHEAIELSDWALCVFASERGRNGKETRIGQDNNTKLRAMLSQTVPGIAFDARVPEDHGNAVALPTFPFISHKFADKEAVAALLQQLPDWCKPIIFEEIKVLPSQYVSDKLISGILGANGLIFIDSPVSNASFWTAFERDFAVRNQKPVFSYNAATDKIEKNSKPPMPLDIIVLNHEDDQERVDSILEWLARERSFSLATQDPDRIARRADAQLLLFQPAQVLSRVMQQRLQSTYRQGGYLVVFLSKSAVQGTLPLIEAPIYAREALATTYFVWLDDPLELSLEAEFASLRDLPKDNHIIIETLPGGAMNRNKIDDLMVRLYWLMHRNGSSAELSRQEPIGAVAMAEKRSEGEMIEEAFGRDFDYRLQDAGTLMSDRALASYRLIEDGVLRILRDLESGAIRRSQPNNEDWYWRLARVRACLSEALADKGNLKSAKTALEGEIEVYRLHCKTSFTVEKAFAFAHATNKLSRCSLALGETAAARVWNAQTEKLLPLLEQYTPTSGERYEWDARFQSIKRVARELKTAIDNSEPARRKGLWSRVFGGRN
jgi:tetratricopeptide (TPR) repeat protein